MDILQFGFLEHYEQSSNCIGHVDCVRDKE